MSNYEQVMNTQYGGNHYKDRKIQPWEVWEAYDMNGWEASALKYLLRYKDKGKPLEDLHKCMHNIQYLIAQLERKTLVQNQSVEGQSAKVFASMVSQLQPSSQCPTKTFAKDYKPTVGCASDCK